MEARAEYKAGKGLPEEIANEELINGWQNNLDKKCSSRKKANTCVLD
jgi:hypothetical protein